MPSQRTRQFTHNHWSEERASEQSKISSCHPLAAFVDKVQVAHSGINKRLKRCQSNTLEESCSEERVIVMAARASPHRADDDYHRSQQVEMSLSPYSRTRHEDEACKAHAKEVVARQQRDSREAYTFDSQNLSTCWLMFEDIDPHFVQSTALGSACWLPEAATA